MERVTGIGGVFFKANDRAGLLAWYREHLGLRSAPDDDAIVLRWREADDPECVGSTTWALFPADTTYFEPSGAPFMVNYRVRNLDAMLAQLRGAGVRVDDRVEDTPFGRFGWAMDPEGNRFELWQAPDGM
jgi:predicted enzyme related to lactoylglutathione lyase